MAAVRASSYRRLAREGKGRRHIPLDRNQTVSDQLAEAADRLSSMADKVAGFAISSSLLLTFACLKDIGDWVKHQPWQFAVGTFVAGCIYVAAVLWLYFQELQVRAMSDSFYRPAGWGASVVDVGSMSWHRSLHRYRYCRSLWSQPRTLVTSPRRNNMARRPPRRLRLVAYGALARTLAIASPSPLELPSTTCRSAAYPRGTRCGSPPWTPQLGGKRALCVGFYSRDLHAWIVKL